MAGSCQGILKEVCVYGCVCVCVCACVCVCVCVCVRVCVFVADTTVSSSHLPKARWLLLLSLLERIDHVGLEMCFCVVYAFLCVCVCVCVYIYICLWVVWVCGVLVLLFWCVGVGAYA